jgi:hypothetical protein
MYENEFIIQAARERLVMAQQEFHGNPVMCIKLRAFFCEHPAALVPFSHGHVIPGPDGFCKVGDDVIIVEHETGPEFFVKVSKSLVGGYLVTKAVKEISANIKDTTGNIKDATADIKEAVANVRDTIRYSRDGMEDLLAAMRPFIESVRNVAERWELEFRTVDGIVIKGSKKSISDEKIRKMVREYLSNPLSPSCNFPPKL